MQPIEFRDDVSGTITDASGSSAAAGILVDVEGAVTHPGVYRLSQDARVDDALAAAGGMTRQADMEAVARGVNRAAVLSDGAKLYIPSLGEQTETAGRQVQQTADTVNINTATSAQLDTLSGVGPVTAGNIIAGRPYTRLEELTERKIISQNLFEKLKDQLVL